jgi:hypothetical protein
VEKTGLVERCRGWRDEGLGDKSYRSGLDAASEATWDVCARASAMAVVMSVRRCASCEVETRGTGKAAGEGSYSRREVDGFSDRLE